MIFFETFQKAITDLSTGELIYLIDDNGGSEIFIEIISTVLMTSFRDYVMMTSQNRKRDS